MKLNLIFPTPVYNIIDEADDCRRQQLRDACLQISNNPEVSQKKNIFHRVGTSHLIDDQLHKREAFLPLAAHINKHSTEFITALGFPGWHMDIARMWTNVGTPGDFVYPHTHVGDGFLAGVFYVSCDKRDGISILDAVERTSPEVSNDLNCSSYYYEGIEGRLLMFRAETLHTTFPQQGEERIIISFNLQLHKPDKDT